MRVRRSIALLCLLSLGACQTWKNYTPGPPPPDLDATAVRVYTADDTWTVLETPQVAAPHLVGVRDGEARYIPLDSITAFETKGANVGAAGFVILVGIPALLFAGLISKYK